MNFFASFLFIVIFTTTAVGQGLQEPRLPTNVNEELDSIKPRNARHLDSLSSQLSQGKEIQVFAESKLGEMDSVKNSVTTNLDSVSNRVDTRIKPVRVGVNNRIDSLKSHLSTGSKECTDSVFTSNQVLNKVDSTASAMKTGIREQTSQISNANTSISLTKRPDTGIPIDELSPAGMSIPQPDGLRGPADDMNIESGLDKMGQTLSVPKELSEIEALDKVKEMSKNVEELTRGIDDQKSNISDLNKLSKTLEDDVLNSEKVLAVQGELDKVEELQKSLPMTQDPDSAKKEVVKIIKSKLVNHFAGKDQALKAAMATVAKYKAKYGEFSSLKNLPKRKPNAMKNKSFRERLLPGVTFQIQRKEEVLIDFNPLVSYKLSGKLTAGIGWNERIGITKSFRTTSSNRIYGPRAYSSFKIGRGYILKMEGEMMRTFLPPPVSVLLASGDARTKEWVTTLFAGLKKDYQFFKSVKGNVQILYNLYHDHNESPYADRLNMRFGFELPIKKRIKKER